MKKLISLSLALVLALALVIPAAASGSGGAASAGSVSVQLNGEDVTFPNASPEVTNGRTMVPMRAVLEALGAEVDYDGDTKTVTAALGDISLTHVIDTSTIEMGDGEKLTMDTTSYVKSGSTLVPLRFFSQALGYEVYWDDGQRTAVVIDKASCISEMDKNFTILNGFQSKKSDTSVNAAVDVDLSGEIKLLDGMSDDALPFSAKMTAAVSEEAVNISGSMDLSAVAALAELEDDPDTAALVPMLSDLTFEIIGGESLWVNVPVLTSLVLEEAAEGDVWLKSNDFSMSTVTAAETTSIGTIGSALYNVVEAMDADNPVNIYRDLAQAANILTVLIGDSTFTEDNGDYSWELDETAAALLTAFIGEEPDSISMAMEIKADGSDTFSMSLRIEDTIEMSISGESNDTSATVKCQLTIPEVCDVTVESTATMKDGGKAPVTAPPAGATVIDVDEMLAAPSVADAIGGADGPTAMFTTEAA